MLTMTTLVTAATYYEMPAEGCFWLLVMGFVMGIISGFLDDNK